MLNNCVLWHLILQIHVSCQLMLRHSRELDGLFALRGSKSTIVVLHRLEELSVFLLPFTSNWDLAAAGRHIMGGSSLTRVKLKLDPRVALPPLPSTVKDLCVIHANKDHEVLNQMLSEQGPHRSVDRWHWPGAIL